MRGGGFAPRGSPLAGEREQRTEASRVREAQVAASAARVVLRHCPELYDRVAMLDVLGLLPAGWPRDQIGRASCRERV